MFLYKSKVWRTKRGRKRHGLHRRRPKRVVAKVFRVKSEETDVYINCLGTLTSCYYNGIKWIPAQTPHWQNLGIKKENKILRPQRSPLPATPREIGSEL